ncbi:MAG: helix-turn-helix domain-containing protein [Solirubrobacterales bacterium]
MASEPGPELRIGNALKEARQRAGLDIRTVEEKTKIRTRYLRALESEEWEVLPGQAYVKGFLRTYAGLLGLDGDALVDEYRRTVEGPQASPVPLGEGVLQGRGRLRDPGGGGGGPSRGLIVGGLIVAIVAILLVLGLTGGDDPGGEKQAKGDNKERSKGDGNGNGAKPKRKRKPDPVPKTVTIRLVTRSEGLQVCLLGDQDQPLIDGQVLSAGTEEVATGKRLILRFPAGYDVSQFDLFVAGKKRKIAENGGPAAFAIEPPDVVDPLNPPGQSCP